MVSISKWGKSVAVAALIAAWYATAWGQVPAAVAPSAEQMVEQLKTQPRLRSLRNLTVEAASPAADAAAAGNAATGTATDAASPQVVAERAQAPSLSLSIQFDFNSARIRAESFVALGNLVTALQSPALAQTRFAVEGHTDAKGSADYNRKLSAQRAQSVKDFLTGKGVDAQQLVTSGLGSSDLANKADPLAAENRRVRIVNLD